MINLPTPGKMTRQQIHRYRALLALQLRASGMDYRGIALVLVLPSRQRARQLTAKGVRLFQECILDTILI